MVELAGNVASIVRFAPPEHRISLLFTYLRVKLKHAFLVGLLHLPIRGETMLGFHVDFFDYRTFVLLFEEIFVTDVYYFKCESAAPFILDCGSNIGMSVLYFKWLYPESRITAFEPDREICRLLQRNVARNRLANVSVVNKALYSSEGLVPFYFNPRHPGSTVNSMVRESLPGAQETETQATRLSTYITENVDFLKMDIEGMEDVVVEELSAANKLRQIRELAVEYHHHLKPSGQSLSRFLAFLEGAGFGYQIQASLRTPFRKDEMQAMFLYAYRK
ncbi:MAG: FkbM family methyltransferase [Acidobacteria bacterium]|nr:FkbM family methyltransferase [Acidobacteriota bacterium]